MWATARGRGALAAAAASPASGPAPRRYHWRPGACSGTRAAAHGTVNPPGHRRRAYSFQYGPTTAYGHQTAVAVAAAAGQPEAVKVGEQVAGLLSELSLPAVVPRTAAAATEGHDLRRIRRESRPSPRRHGFVLRGKKLRPRSRYGGDVCADRHASPGTANGEHEIVLQASPFPYTAVHDVGGAAPDDRHRRLLLPRRRYAHRHRVPCRDRRQRPAATARSLTAQVQSRDRAARALEQPQSASFRLYGTVTPAELGAPCSCSSKSRPRKKTSNTRKPSKLEKPGKRNSEKAEKGATFATKFKTVVKPGTKTLSRFSVVVNVATTGHYRVIVEIAAWAAGSGTQRDGAAERPRRPRARRRTRRRAERLSAPGARTATAGR